MKGMLIYLSFWWHKPFFRLKKLFKSLCCSHKPLEDLGEISESTMVSYSPNFFYSVERIRSIFN